MFDQLTDALSGSPWAYALVLAVVGAGVIEGVRVLLRRRALPGGEGPAGYGT